MNIMKHFIAILLSSLLLFSCGKDDDTGGINGTAPILPPIETMVIDFGEMTKTTKSTDTLESNWFYSATSVVIWNAIIGTTFAVPVACFSAAANQTATQKNDITWQWEYDVDEYTAHLEGRFIEDEIKWRMEISKEGESGFSDFLWFEGTSKIGRLSGHWILYHSPEFPEETIQIDWTKEGAEVGEITYSYIRLLNNDREDNSLYGSSLSYGLQNETFDAYVDIHLKDVNSDIFTDTSIEWSRTNYAGRIMAEHIFADNEWHCWDQQANNTDCN
jgi:hypothetical protein